MTLKQIFDPTKVDSTDRVRLAFERLRARTDDPDVQTLISAVKISAKGVMPVGTRVEYGSNYRPERGFRHGRIVAHETELALFTSPVVRYDDDGETRAINQDVLREER